MFILGKVGDISTTVVIAIAVGVSVPCIAAVIIALLIYCYKLKNRYHRHTEVSAVIKQQI